LIKMMPRQLRIGKAGAGSHSMASQPVSLSLVIVPDTVHVVRRPEAAGRGGHPGTAHTANHDTAPVERWLSEGNVSEEAAFGCVGLIL
jgi:hypothetical protein